MWTRRDFAVLATAAIATFGLTLTAFFPRLADAVDQAPAALNIRVPTLDLGTAQVSAALDPANPQGLLFTVKNASDDPAHVDFLAQVMETPSMSGASRRAPTPQPIWSQEYSVELLPGQIMTLRGTVSSFQAPAQQTQAQTSQALMIPPSRFLTLSGKNQPGTSITALNFKAPEPAKAPS